MPDGTPLNDFRFVERQRALHVLNAPSPGATASLAIGDVISRMVHSQLN
jgi:L-2-hydroxyglutarate oxidase